MQHLLRMGLAGGGPAGGLPDIFPVSEMLRMLLSQGAGAEGGPLGALLQSPSLPLSHPVLAPLLEVQQQEEEEEEEQQLLSTADSSPTAEGATDSSGSGGSSGSTEEHKLAEGIMAIVHKINDFKDKLEAAYRARNDGSQAQAPLQHYGCSLASDLPFPTSAAAQATALSHCHSFLQGTGDVPPGPQAAQRHTTAQPTGEVLSPGTDPRITSSGPRADVASPPPELVMLLTLLLKAGQARAAPGSLASLGPGAGSGISSIGAIMAQLRSDIAKVLGGEAGGQQLAPAQPGSVCACVHCAEDTVKAVIAQQTQHVVRELQQKLPALSAEQRGTPLFTDELVATGEKCSPTHPGCITNGQQAIEKAPCDETNSSGEDYDAPTREERKGEGFVRPIRDRHRLGDDGYGWKKYSHKVLKGKDIKRHYYACSKKEKHQCPARKIVDRVLKGGVLDKDHDAVTYEGEHNHPPTFQNQPRLSGSPGEIGPGVQPTAKVTFRVESIGAKFEGSTESQLGDQRLLAEEVKPLGHGAPVVHHSQELGASTGLVDGWPSQALGTKRKGWPAGTEELHRSPLFTPSKIEVVNESSSPSSGRTDTLSPGTPAKRPHLVHALLRTESTASVGPSQAYMQSQAAEPVIPGVGPHLNSLSSRQASLGLSPMRSSTSTVAETFSMNSLRHSGQPTSLAAASPLADGAPTLAKPRVKVCHHGPETPRKEVHAGSKDPAEEASKEEQGTGLTQQCVEGEAKGPSEEMSAEGSAMQELPDSYWSDTADRFFVEPVVFSSFMD